MDSMDNISENNNKKKMISRKVMGVKSFMVMDVMARAEKLEHEARTSYTSRWASPISRPRM